MSHSPFRIAVMQLGSLGSLLIALAAFISMKAPIRIQCGEYSVKVTNAVIWMRGPIARNDAPSQSTGALAGVINSHPPWNPSVSYPRDWRTIASLTRTIQLMPRMNRNPGQLEITFPMWLLFASVATPTALAWLRSRRRIPAGHCPACAYDLTGNVSGVCPECGKKVERHVGAQS